VIMQCPVDTKGRLTSAGSRVGNGSILLVIMDHVVGLGSSRPD
jgi:hypothetical protein